MPIAREDRARRRLAIALAGAVIAHALVAWVGDRWKFRQNGDDLLTGTGVPTEDVEVDLLTTEIAPRAVDIEQPNEHDGNEARVALAMAHAKHSVPSAPVAGEPATNAEGTEPAVEPSEGAYAADPRSAVPDPEARPVDLGITAGSWSRYVDPRATPSADSAPSRPNAKPTAPVSSTGGIVEALEAHDQSVGIGPAGAVLTAIHQVGYSDATPALGSAIFSITVSRAGLVEVALTGASSRLEDWAKMGESVAAAIRKRPPRISDGRNGVRLRVEVVAEERWPNGQVARGEGPELVAKGFKFQPVETAREEMLDRNPAAVPPPDTPSDKPKIQANFATPTLGIRGRGKVCSYQVGLSLIPISGGCDPANIGAPPRRVVSTRVIEQTML